MKKITFLLVLTVLFACSKESIPKNQSFKDGANQVAKTTKITPLNTFVLVSSSILRLGFLPDGDPYGGMVGYNNLVWAVTQSGNATHEIYNPNLFLGAPVNPTGASGFLGIAVDKSVGSHSFPGLILCRSRSSEHALYFASENANQDYEINSYTIVSAPFAPAGNGWRLHDIELGQGVMYGIFFNYLTTESKVVSIDKSTGVATLVKSFVNKRFGGLEFDASTIFLLSYDSTNTAELYKLNRVTNTHTVTTVPAVGSTTTDYLRSFLAIGNNGSNNLYMYAEWTSVIYNYDLTLNTLNSSITQRNVITLPSTVGAPSAISPNVVLIDAAN